MLTEEGQQEISVSHRTQTTLLSRLRSNRRNKSKVFFNGFQHFGGGLATGGRAWHLATQAKMEALLERDAQKSAQASEMRSTPHTRSLKMISSNPKSKHSSSEKLKNAIQGGDYRSTPRARSLKIFFRKRRSKHSSSEKLKSDTQGGEDRST